MQWQGVKCDLSDSYKDIYSSGMVTETCMDGQNKCGARACTGSCIAEESHTHLKKNVYAVVPCRAAATDAVLFLLNESCDQLKPN